ncbi:MAG: c-type cytochrome [Nitrosomonadales bacterium]|nr:c-type cytochrome [Nitrosomonadales bacterium]
MKSIVISMIAAAGLMAAGSAMATEMPPLAKKHNCTSCHTVDKKLVGPAYADVAKKYKGQADAEAKLVAKVSKGGAGVWGTMPMPPNAPKVPEADIKELVKWVLSL